MLADRDGGRRETELYEGTMSVVSFTNPSIGTIEHKI
jgi:hypothetical protein